ncbi:hypothetical protein KY289_024602 [Solanum tuberosum]|nr:hypothetical protein KY289_024602 [Solanum tuberosum]
MDYLKEEEQSCVIDPAPQRFASMNQFYGLSSWGHQVRLICYKPHTDTNNANSASSFMQGDASPK